MKLGSHKHDNDERLAPARLRRAEVAALRALYNRAWSWLHAHEHMTSDPPAWEAMTTVLLDRERSAQALARIGAPVPAGTVTVAWTRNRAWGLDATFRAHTRLGAANDRITEMGRHRFRTEVTQGEFCRITAQYLRRALGHVKSERGLLENVFADS